MNFPLFIARRISGKTILNTKVSRPAVSIAIAGVAIGLAVMIITVSVVIGFKHTIRNKVFGFGGHITLAEYFSIQGMDQEQHPIEINDSLCHELYKIKGIKNIQRYTYAQGIFKTDNDFLGIILKGINSDYDTTFIHSNMIEGSIPQYSKTKNKNLIVISKTIADKLNLKLNDRIFAYFLNEKGFLPRRFKICGIYETNLKQYDSQICLSNIYTVNKINGWKSNQYSGAEIIVKNIDDLNKIAYNISKKIRGKRDNYGNRYSSATVMEQNPQIFSWLNLMDLNVWIIFVLMIAVACVTMISGLLIIILERTQMIGLLKAIGGRNSQIRHIFLWLASFIICKGLLWGDIIGIGLVLFQQFTSAISLDEKIYYVNTVPVELNIPIVIALNIATLFICLIILIIPSYLISHIAPAKTMKYE